MELQPPSPFENFTYPSGLHPPKNGIIWIELSKIFFNFNFLWLLRKVLLWSHLNLFSRKLRYFDKGNIVWQYKIYMLCEILVFKTLQCPFTQYSTILNIFTYFKTHSKKYISSDKIDRQKFTLIFKISCIYL